MSLPARISDYSHVINYVYRKYRDHLSEMTYHELVDAILKHLSNKKRSSYKEYAKTSQEDRHYIAEQLADILRDHFVQRQPAGYRHTQQARPVYQPTEKENLSMELIADYILAEDHAKGLAVKRTPNRLPQEDDAFPPMGDGAAQYAKLCEFKGTVLTDEYFVKNCEVCGYPFIDDSRAKNARVCGSFCRKRKDKLRKRAEYTGGDNRLKRDRERQDYDYPFYSPKEMKEISRHGEKAYDEKKLGQISDKRQFKELNGGIKKPSFVTNSKGDYNGFKYSPNMWKKWRVSDEPGEVVTYNLNDVSEEFMKAREWTYLGEKSI